MAEKQTRSAGAVLDGEKKRMIHPHFDGCDGFWHRTGHYHFDRGGGGGFRAGFVQFEQGSSPES